MAKLGRRDNLRILDAESLLKSQQVYNSMYFLLGTPLNVNDLTRTARSYAGNNRKQVPIAVIDDEPFQYLELLRNHNFDIRVFPDIADVAAVETYEVVLCDIRGVGKHFQSKKEGAHLIGEIRKHYPRKVLIAYSGSQFDPSYNQYFSQCDQVIKKDIDSDEWIERLDEAISVATNAREQWQRLRDYLLKRDVPLIMVVRLEHEYVKSILKGTDAFPSQKSLQVLPDDIRAIINSFSASVIFRLLIGG